MPLRRRYKLKHWFWGVAWLAVLLSLCVFFGSWTFASVRAGLLLMHRFPFDNRLLLYTPGGVALALSLVVAFSLPRYRLAALAATGAAAAAMIYPEVQAWYVWNVMRDHTANIGYGILKMGLPLTAPVAAILAGVSVAVVKAIVWETPASADSSGASRRTFPPIVG